MNITALVAKKPICMHVFILCKTACFNCKHCILQYFILDWNKIYLSSSLWKKTIWRLLYINNFLQCKKKRINSNCISFILLTFQCSEIKLLPPKWYTLSTRFSSFIMPIVVLRILYLLAVHNRVLVGMYVFRNSLTKLYIFFKPQNYFILIIQS